MEPTEGKKSALPGILAVLGVALAAPLVLPTVAALSRPLAKSLIKGFLALTDTVKEYTAEAGETISDLMAEAKAEHAADLAATIKTSKTQH